MLNRNKPFGMCYGRPGVAYEQEIDGKTRLYNEAGQEVRIIPDSKGVEIIEPLPDEPEIEFVETEPEKPNEPEVPEKTVEESSLTIHERLRITDTEDPNYLTDDAIKLEFDAEEIKYDKRWGRKRLVKLLKKELGI